MSDLTGPDGAAITVRAVIETYLLHEGQRLSARSLRDMREALDLFVERLGDKPVAACVPFDLAAWFSENPGWVSEWTRHRHCKSVQRPFNWASKMGLIQKNPFLGFSQPKGPPGRAMTDDEFAALAAGVAVPFGRILRFLRYTGARPCEARELLWEWVVPEQAVAVYLKHKTVRTRRDRKPRVLVLPEAAIAVLIEIQEESPRETGHVFRNHRGEPWTSNAFNLHMQRLRKRVGLPKGVKLYGLRHRYGTTLAQAGVSLKLLAELMGHTSVQMTEHYVHLAGQADVLRKVLGQVAL